MVRLSSTVQYLKGVGPKRADLLIGKNIRTVEDVLFNFPRKYKDYSNIVPICDLKDGGDSVIRGRVIKSYKGSPFGKVKYRMTVSDGTGSATAIWFQRLNGLDGFQTGEEVYLSGKVIYRAAFTFVHPSVERVDAKTRRAGKISPVYSEVDGIGEGSWANIAFEALKTTDRLEEILPSEIVIAHSFPTRQNAIREIHIPTSIQSLRKARERFIYEEFFILQTSIAIRRLYQRSVIKQNPKQLSANIEKRIRARFPFTFTNAQNKVISEIVSDMTSKSPMNRLLQGDVGSGKTAVALFAALLAVANKSQTAILVPTEVLALQHYNTVTKFLKNSRVQIGLLTGSLPLKERNQVCSELKSGKINIVIGTHALLSENIEFSNLGLTIIDEQHRFGVAQRAKLRKKGSDVDSLVMTATPIPRTLSMTIYGDLDVSIIDKLPPGRKPIRTLRFPLDAEFRAHTHALEEVKQGGQVYVVCPFIEKSEEITGNSNPDKDLRSAIQTYERLSEKVYPNFSVGIVHGRMPGVEREMVMADFRSGKIQVLVSTVLIEVGIDVPNANVMLIQHAERFGLATLHQLRGRVGRGSRLSYCLCVADLKNEETRNRMEIFCSTTDGFQIAEEDLKMRGPGQVLGTQQHGSPALMWASVEKDYETLKMARSDAFSLVKRGWRPGNEFRHELEKRDISGKSFSTIG